MFQILDGKKLARNFFCYLQKEIKGLPIKPRLLVLMVGQDHASQIFVRKKKEICHSLGVSFSLVTLPASSPAPKICQVLRLAIKQKKPHGVVVQLPLPQGIARDQVLKCIPKKMDVEGFKNRAVISPVALGIAALLAEYKIGMNGRKVAVVGAGKLVGEPTARLMRKLGASVKVYDQSIKALAVQVKKADIVISGVGEPNLIRGTMIRKGAVVIDAGTSWKAGKIRGDVEMASVKKKASFLAPVPGGVGPMTVMMLLMNLVELMKFKSPPLSQLK